MLDLAANENIIVKSGAWFAYNGDKIGQGRENSKLWLLQNPAAMAEIEAKVRAKLCVAPNADANEEIGEFDEDAEDKD